MHVALAGLELLPQEPPVTRYLWLAFFSSSKPPYRFSKVVSFWIFLLIRLGLELGLRLGLGVRVGVGFGFGLLT
jgi:hypothetical protein